MAEFAIPHRLVTPSGTLIFNDWPNDGLVLTGVSGNDGGIIRTSSDVRPQRDGAVIFPAYRGARQLVLEGSVAARSMASRLTLVDRLLAYADAIRQADGTLSWGPSNGSGWRQSTVRLHDNPQIGGSKIKTFQLPLISGDPFAYSQTLYTADTGSFGAIGGGWTFPFALPSGFGAASVSSSTFTNAGTVPSAPVIRIYGSITAPVLRNLTTGLYVSLPGLILNTPDYIEIDMAKSTVLLNGLSAYPMISTVDVVYSNFWSLLPGANVVQLVGFNYDGNAKARVIWRDAFL